MTLDVMCYLRVDDDLHVDHVDVDMEVEHD